MGAPDIGCRGGRDKRLVHKYPPSALGLSSLASDIMPGKLAEVLSTRRRALYGRVANPTPPLVRPALASCLRASPRRSSSWRSARAALSGQERGKPPKLDPPPKQAGGMRFHMGARRPRRQVRQRLQGMGVGQGHDHAGHAPATSRRSRVRAISPARLSCSNLRGGAVTAA